jgi:DNA-binding Lrp family transcriptional regulator
MIGGMQATIVTIILYAWYMVFKDADRSDVRGWLSNDVRPGIDEIDRRILGVLGEDARIPNNALAERVGVAPSTCLGRVRALRERGVIRGYHADVDPAALGRPLQAMISVRLASSARGHIASFGAEVARMPAVLNVYFLGGADDFYVHVSAASSDELREFVVALSADPDVALTQTNLIFEHVRGAAPGPS